MDTLSSEGQEAVGHGGNRVNSMIRPPNFEFLLFEIFTWCPCANYLTSRCCNFLILKILLVISTIHTVILPEVSNITRFGFFFIPPKKFYAINSPEMYGGFFFFFLLKKHFFVPFPKKKKKKLTVISWRSFRSITQRVSSIVLKQLSHSLSYLKITSFLSPCCATASKVIKLLADTQWKIVRAWTRI